jgi:uncharacterized protein (DUF302 family)
MIKNILALLGAVVLVVVVGAYAKFGGMITKVQGLDSGALPAYMTMFDNVLKTGDPAYAMMKEFDVLDDVENEDVVESIKALAEEYNMRVVGDTKMFTIPDAKGDEVKFVENISLCSLYIAKKFLAHSRYFGGFMPCRIMLIEYGNGKRKLITMDLELAIHGGTPLPPEMLELATKVQEAMIQIPARAAEGDF